MTHVAEGRRIVPCGPHQGGIFASVLFDRPYCTKLIHNHYTTRALQDIEPLRQFVIAHSNTIGNVQAWITAFGRACKGTSSPRCYPCDMPEANSCRLGRYLATLGCPGINNFIYVHADRACRNAKLPPIVDLVDTPEYRYCQFAPHPSLDHRYIYVPEHVNVERLHAWHMPPLDPDVLALGMGKRLARIQLLVSPTWATFTFAANEISIVPDITARNGAVLSDGCGRISAEALEKVVTTLRPMYSRTIVGTVTAVQARIGPCKGMFVRDTSLPGVQIIISNSQAKYWKNPGAWDDMQRTLEVCDAGVVDHMKKEEAKVNKQIIPLLEHHCGPAAMEIFCDIQNAHVQRKIAAVLEVGTSSRALPGKLNAMRAAGIRQNEPEFVNAMALYLTSELEKKCIAKASYILPDSVWVRIVPDFSSTLRRGQCVLVLANPHTQRVIRGNVVVARNPCFVPSDVEMWFAVKDDVPRFACENVLICAAGLDLDCGAATALSGGDYDGDYVLVSWYKPLVDAFASYKNYPQPPRIDNLPAARSNRLPATGWGAFQMAQRAFYEEFYPFVRKIGEWPNLVGRVQDYLGADNDVTLTLGALAHHAMDAAKQGWCCRFFDGKKLHLAPPEIPVPPWHAPASKVQPCGDDSERGGKLQVLTVMDRRVKGLVQLLKSWALFDPIEHFAIDTDKWSFLAREMNIVAPEAGDPDLLPCGMCEQSDECCMQNLLDVYLGALRNCTDYVQFREEIIPRLRRTYGFPSDNLASVLYAVCYARADAWRKQYHAGCGSGARDPARPFRSPHTPTACVNELQERSDATLLTNVPNSASSRCLPRQLMWRALKADKDLLACLKCPFEIAESELLALKKRKMAHRSQHRHSQS